MENRPRKYTILLILLSSLTIFPFIDSLGQTESVDNRIIFHAAACILSLYLLIAEPPPQ